VDLRAAWVELDARNRDNVTRTESYLELYAWTRANGCELPWIFMAHLVSRNAGYLMTDLARRLERADDASRAAMQTLFVLLERGNFLIFHDAWHHVIAYLLGEPLASPRTPRYMIDAYARASREDERSLVMDLVHNEQHFIEHRAVHHPDLAPGLRLLALIEASGKDKPLHFPHSDSAIRVGRFADVALRIAAGAKIFDDVIADRARRDAIFDWAVANRHTGSRAIYGGTPGPDVRDAWPVDTIRALWSRVHDAPEPDPSYP
jgi:hypothetical protein